VKFAAERAAERKGELFHFESLSDDLDSFVIGRASIASLTGTINGDAITMICTRTESAGKLHSDPPVPFFIHVDLENKLYLKRLDEKMTVYDALGKMLRAACLPR
jgi:hypothetical protein